MTRLRKMMLEELQRRNYSQHTTRSYVRTVEDFARYFNRPPDRLGPQHIREYQAMLFHKRKLSPGSVAVHLAALRFFYRKTLRRAWSVEDTPYPKKDHRLPQILSKQEVERLINAASTAFHRTLLMTLYATGARNAEVTRLKFRDFDKQRMVVHILGAKGRKDRDVMLSSKNCSKNFVSTGAVYGEAPKSGSFRARSTIAGISRSIRKPFGTPAPEPPGELAFRNECILIL